MSTETFEVWGKDGILVTKRFGGYNYWDPGMMEEWGRMLQQAAKQTKSNGEASKLVLYPQKYETVNSRP